MTDDTQGDASHSRYVPLPGNYQGTELLPFQGRPGANDHERYPSRMGSNLTWRDGRTQPHPEKSDE